MSCKIRDIYTVIDCIIDVVNKNDYEINRIKGNGLYLDLKKLQESLMVKISSMCNIVPCFFENMHVINYLSKQVHGPFQDAYDISTDRGKQYTNKLGQRIKTITLFLSDGFDYEYNKLNYTVKCNKGTLLYYDNIENTQQRDDMLSHRVVNNSEDDGYLINIYVREYDTTGKKNKIVDLSSPS